MHENQQSSKYKIYMLYKKKTRCSIEILKYDKTNQSDITKSTLFYSNT